MRLETIPIKLANADNFSIGNVNALLSEITSCLAKLLASHEASAIDLRSLPFAPGEYAHLKQLLGQGEVKARIVAMEISEISETQYAGVWWVTHYDSDEQVAAEFIEVTYAPDILKSHPADVGLAIASLRLRSRSDPETGAESDAETDPETERDAHVG